MAPDLAKTFVVLKPDQTAALVEAGPGVFEELGRRFGGFRGHVLLSCFDFAEDWESWERHPAGDEIVCLLTGDVRLVLERDGGEEVVHLREPGSYVVVPRGTWHTARTRVPTRMLFVTPGEGTENRPA